MSKYETGLIHKVGVNPNLIQDACNKVYSNRELKDKKQTEPKWLKDDHSKDGYILTSYNWWWVKS